MDIIQTLCAELGIKKEQVENTLKLINEGNTIPFIARYRKELTGGLNDEILRDLDERLTYLNNLADRKEQVISLIEELEQLTPELKEDIENAQTLTAVEDLYLPYKSKKRTRATVAKEKGLEELAMIILQGNVLDIDEITNRFIDPEKGVLTLEEAISGASDIIAEMVSDNAVYRGKIRETTFEQGLLVTKLKEDYQDDKELFTMYHDYVEPIKSIPSHRILAINRGENEKALAVKIEIDVDSILNYLYNQVISDESKTKEILENAIEDSYKRLISPSIERDVRNELTDSAQEGAIEVFKKNLYQLLMARPIKGHTVLGLDPGFRTGCKVAVIDEMGKKLASTVIYPTMPRNEVEKSKNILINLINEHNITLVAIGNGTASRETEKLVADMIKEFSLKIHYVIVNEAGASVYSASKLATYEFPNDDVGTRSAVSIARRLQDPLAELVKIEPKAIGVGQYQHDMNQKRLEESLSGVVESAVNEVGVDINTASPSLLHYVSGIKKNVSENIILYREENGAFKNRQEIKNVKGLGPKMFEQCAGFLRIPDGENILDRTGVHPESYSVAQKLIEKIGYAEDVTSFEEIRSMIYDTQELAQELEVGEMTLLDIIKELEKPGRDPREDMPNQILNSEVLEIEDLQIGMRLQGTVRNVVDFGVFVDIGVHQDGLVHVSQLANRFVKHPLEIVSVGDIVDVAVISLNVKAKKIGLTMKDL
ncbi:MAG: RNA-binding transcriptional accessory protein [Candidatus Epulonipiscioides saccharophilum]|nr:MAG: RNA-binding transcriptional accessory protein [Epulopiscium sp. AS2M-Bin001]